MIEIIIIWTCLINRFPLLKRRPTLGLPFRMWFMRPQLFQKRSFFFFTDYSDRIIISSEVVCSPIDKAPSKTDWESTSIIILNIIRAIQTCSLFFVPQLNLCMHVVPLPPKIAGFDIAMHYLDFSHQ